MKKLPLIALAALLTLGVSGCANIDNRLEREFAKVRKGPAGAPYKSVTNFSDALQCMDKQMLVKGVRGIPIMVEDIEDKTESVKTGTRDMLISAISEMTTRSKGIKLIAYGKDAGNLISFMKAANYDRGYAKMPLYDIQGSISQFDKGVASSDASVGLFYRKKGGSGAAHGSSLNVIALDLNLLNATDMSVVSGVTSKNSVAIFQRSDSLDMDASINKMGVYFDLNLNTSDGQAQAVRNLVELAAIELVGKLVGLPYADCLGVTQEKARVAAKPVKLPKLKPKTNLSGKANTAKAGETPAAPKTPQHNTPITQKPPHTPDTRPKVAATQPLPENPAKPDRNKATTAKVKPAVFVIPAPVEAKPRPDKLRVTLAVGKAKNAASGIVRVKRVIKSEVIEEPAAIREGSGMGVN